MILFGCPVFEAFSNFVQAVCSFIPFLWDLVDFLYSFHLGFIATKLISNVDLCFELQMKMKLNSRKKKHLNTTQLAIDFLELIVLKQQKLEIFIGFLYLRKIAIISILQREFLFKENIVCT